MTDEYYDVLRFHDKFNIPVPDAPTPLPKQRLAERANFMLEELLEFTRAAGLDVFLDGGGNLSFYPLEDEFVDQDLPGQADALVDLVYVALGTAVQLGLPWDLLWEDVHRANMAKVRGTSDRAHIDVVKPPGWRGPDTATILKEYGWNENI